MAAGPNTLKIFSINLRYANFNESDFEPIKMLKNSVG